MAVVVLQFEQVGVLGILNMPLRWSRYPCYPLSFQLGDKNEGSLEDETVVDRQVFSEASVGPELGWELALSVGPSTYDGLDEVAGGRVISGCLLYFCDAGGREQDMVHPNIQGRQH